MRLSDIILKEELGVAKRKLQDMLQQNDADFIVDAIMSIEDENVLDVFTQGPTGPCVLLVGPVGP